MSDPRPRNSGPGRGRLMTMAAAALVLALAVGALIWPGDGGMRGQGVFLVFDSSGRVERTDEVFEPLALFLENVTGRPLDIVVVGTQEDFAAQIGRGADLVLGPDGLAIGLDPEKYPTLVVGRRAAPRNLRPRGVLVYRKSAGALPEPWAVRPDRTVFGDSLSLAATGAWRRKGSEGVAGPVAVGACAWGPDTYDHGPVLHAARLGAFDYAVVRQWDADRFFKGGLLLPLEWGVEPLTVPVPDVVLAAGPGLDRATRLELADRLSAIGRRSEGESPLESRLRGALSRLGLVGFNVLVDPDFDLVRRNFAADWLPEAD